MVQRRPSLLCVAAVAASTLVASSPAGAAEEQWSPLQEAGGSTLAVAVHAQSTALISAASVEAATAATQSKDGRRCTTRTPETDRAPE